MNKGSFHAQVNEAEQLLHSIGLLAERNYFPLYAQLRAADFRNLSYIDIWKKCYGDKVFDFRLNDDSLIQFRASFVPLEISYGYYESPYFPVTPLDEFLEEERIIRGDDFDEYEVLREHELIMPELKAAVTPLRYDFAPQLYKEGLHPASHIHFGHANHIRIGTKRILKPLSFVLFIIRQRYPSNWQKILQLESSELLCRNVALNLDEVENTYWQRFDGWEMCLS